MKHALLLPLAAILLVANSHAQDRQDRIFRCGNEYTNNAADAQARGCKVVEGGNVTVVQSARPQPLPVTRVATATQAGQRIDANEQKARDADARFVLEAELKKAEARQSELIKEYNNGEPEKRGDEARNYQKYLDRVAELKSGISRNDSDIAGIKRELDRLTSQATR